MVDDGYGDEEGDGEDTGFDDSWGEDDPDEGGDDGDEKEPKKKDQNSAIKQKQKYRAKLEDAKKEISKRDEEIARLRGEGRNDEADTKERQAEEYMRNMIRKIQEEDAAATRERETKEQEAFDSEVETVLEENEDLVEEEVRSVAKEYGVSPTVAAKIITDRGAKPKAKPKTPTERRTVVAKKASDKEPDAQRPRSLDEVNRLIKKTLT